MNQAMTWEGISNKYTTNTTVGGLRYLCRSVLSSTLRHTSSPRLQVLSVFGLHHYGSLYSGWSNASAHESYFLSTELSGISSHNFLDKLANLPHSDGFTPVCANTVNKWSGERLPVICLYWFLLVLTKQMTIYLTSSPMRLVEAHV